MQKQKISVVGLGFVGLTLAAVNAKKGFSTVGIDIDKEKIEKLKKGIPSFYEPELEKFLKKSLKRKTLQVTNNIKKILETDITFVTVGTPSKNNGDIDLSYINKALNTIYSVLKDKKIPHTLVIKSTILPTTTNKIIYPKFKKLKNVNLLVNPEFLREGNAINDLINPHIIVIGEKQKKSSNELKKYYKKFYNKKIDMIITDYNTTELIKYSNNVFLATKLSFINSISSLCEKIQNADIKIISKAIGKDSRIGNEFLNAGPGFGGSCLPKDLYALVNFTKKINSQNQFFSSVKNVNDFQPKKIMNIIKKKKISKNNPISILGLSFKSGTDDIRESIAIKMISLLLSQKFRVNVHDPMAINNTKKIFGNKIKYTKSINSCLKNSGCCLILTDWDEYKKLNQKVFLKNMKFPYIIDTRRILKNDDFSETNLISFGLGHTAEI